MSESAETGSEIEGETEVDVETVTILVPDGQDGERLDRLLALETGRSRSEIAAAVETGSVAVRAPSADGDTAHAAETITVRSRRVAAGEVVEARLAPRSDGRPQPDASIDVPVVYEDDHIIVVDKPVGLVVHPGSGRPDGTLANGLLARFPEIADVGDPTRPGIVHRLDRGTSGLLVVARTEQAYERLVEDLAERLVTRIYRVIVYGEPEADGGRIEAPLGRHPRDRLRMAVVAQGRDAITDYDVLTRWPDAPAALLSCRLHTGRTHQIRVHLAAIDLRVLGDDRYGRLAFDAQRPMLHAAELGLAHPETGEELEFSAPDPEDFSALIDRLGDISV